MKEEEIIYHQHDYLRWLYLHQNCLQNFEPSIAHSNTRHTIIFSYNLHTLTNRKFVLFLSFLQN